MIESAPLAETVRRLREGETDLETYLDELCDRIDRVDPELRAFVPESDRRERISESVDRLEASDDGDRPPLYGVPVGVKDIFHVDGLTTGAGTAVPPEIFQGPEASVVSTLRDAGAVVLGKTVTPEFAGGAPGHTRNPHDTDHTPGGSSSGSAAAVAAGLCPLALGTQTGGSVVRPASFCGVVGFKPSFGRIPREGVLARSETLDHVGLFTQDLEGMELAASIVCEGWESTAPDREPTLGVPEGPYLESATDRALADFEDRLRRLEEAGYGIERVRIFENFEETDQKRAKTHKAELAMHHEEWFEEYEPFYRAPCADRIRSGQKVTIEELLEGRRVIEQRRPTLEAAMDEHGIDVWVSPAAPDTAPEGITSTGDPVMNRPWTDSGMPAITLPAGEIEGLPMGLQCTTRFMEGERLLGWAEGLLDAASD
jgi:Asp-tRNA(Asn)/Glu-tRNA(Gln) amidotransferase A subunit family amidase